MRGRGGVAGLLCLVYLFPLTAQLDSWLWRLESVVIRFNQLSILDIWDPRFTYSLKFPKRRAEMSL